MLDVLDVPLPQVGPDEALVGLAGAGLCQSDLHVLHLPNWSVQNMTLGYERAGHVAALGKDVQGFADGDAVLVHLVRSCGACGGPRTCGPRLTVTCDGGLIRQLPWPR